MRRASRLPLEALQPYLLETAAPHPPFTPNPLPAREPLEWQAFFGNANPVEIEVGFGKGLFLVETGAARPQTNFLGIEIERKYVLFTATRLAKRELRNVRVACGDARHLLADRIADASVQAMHVYFPDPWWKNRHRKRRLLTLEFARQCGRVLISGGVFHLMTDVAAYFDETLTMFREIPALERLPESALAVAGLTNFERKYRKEGRPIYRADFAKR